METCWGFGDSRSNIWLIPQRITPSAPLQRRVVAMSSGALISPRVSRASSSGVSCSICHGRMFDYVCVHVCMYVCDKYVTAYLSIENTSNTYYTTKLLKSTSCPISTKSIFGIRINVSQFQFNSPHPMQLFLPIFPL